MSEDPVSGMGGPYQLVVVGTDGSPSAERAVRQGAELAKAFGAGLVVVAAFSHPSVPPPAPPQLPDLDEHPEEVHERVADAAQAEARAEAGRVIAQEVGVSDVRSRVIEGGAAEALVGVADELGADLIVVGSRGMTKADRFLLGSVPNQVSHHAPCDLVIARTSG